MKRNELRKLMDCCRADSQDLTEPEMSVLAESLEHDPGVRGELMAIHAWDAKIDRALHDVPVPAGLAERILDATARTGGEAAEEVQGRVRDDVEQPTVEPAQSQRRRWRILLPAGVTAGLAAAAAIVAMIAWFAGWGDNLTGTQVAELAREWVVGLDQAGWNREPAPNGYPVDPSLRFPPIGWQYFQARALGDSRAVVYKVEVPPDHSSAYLLVMRTRQGRLLPKFPQATPDSTTGGLCVGAWKTDDGCLYALVVPGNENIYRRVLRSQSLAIALPHATIWLPISS